MNVLNIHERELNASPSQVGLLIDQLATKDDPLWPRDQWPAMKFDRPLEVGAAGGHGPIRYFVEAYEPGRSIQFRFTGPRGFDGYHVLDVQEIGPQRVRLKHKIAMNTTGPARLTWPLVFRPLHDALLEDALDKAQTAVGMSVQPSVWSPWVRFLRWLLARVRRR